MKQFEVKEEGLWGDVELVFIGNYHDAKLVYDIIYNDLQYTNQKVWIEEIIEDLPKFKTVKAFVHENRMYYNSYIENNEMEARKHQRFLLEYKNKKEIKC